MAAELPFHLKTLEPLRGALDIIRFLDGIDEPTADADVICDTLDLSDRSFSKAIRRLVTKGYVVMDGELIYRLTDQGTEAAQELNVYDEATGGGLGEMVASDGGGTEQQTVNRRFIVALPGRVVAGQPSELIIGVHDAASSGMSGTAEMVARVSIVNGQPETPEDVLFSLGDGATKQSLEITPARYTEMRIRVNVFQLGDNPGEIHTAGGMYIDVPVTSETAGQAPLTAFGTDIQIVI